MIPCGHSFCKVCINGFWEEEKGVYSCPQCKDTFTLRPDLRKNTMLAEMVERVQKAEIRAAPSAQRYAGPGDVACDSCTERRHKAIIKAHLVEALPKLQEKICSQHKKLFDIYCLTDQKCICSSCVLENHKGHAAVSLSAGRTEKQKKLKEERRQSQQIIQEKQKKVEELKCSVIRIKSRAQTAVEKNDIIFTEMISSMEKKRSEVTEWIRAQEKDKLSQAERLLEQLEEEITDHKRRVTELEQLSHTQDHIHFLQSFQSLCFSSGHRDSRSFTLQQPLSFCRIMNSLSDLKTRFEEFCEDQFQKVPQDEVAAAAVQKISPLEPKSREEFLKYFCYLTLDEKTSHHRFLRLSENNRVATFSWINKLCSFYAERFDSCFEVLCKESICGCSYWEVDWGNHSSVHISVSYKGRREKEWGKECGFGCNSQSWSLYCSSSSSPFFFYHNNTKTELCVPPSPRIGVYVDYSAGTLSFYHVSDTMRLIHRVSTKFTQPLYAGFGVYKGSVRLCDPK
ncbi:tripartite motif-containing protein 16-like protein [Clarias gariepinus]|uniref:tripartite motif-containing protein 16-like protein n=1 Tax=Clarias gariepinus TaxID=13013 RepID=UPI00234C5F7E|nr:tripartite motif-containing protein 16-like protein [Clarias gariepinus]